MCIIAPGLCLPMTDDFPVFQDSPLSVTCTPGYVSDGTRRARAASWLLGNQRLKDRCAYRHVFGADWQLLLESTMEST